MKKYFIIAVMTISIIIFAFFTTKYLIEKDIENTSWKLSGWNVSSLSSDVANITLEFKDNKISGNGGVNSYSGIYTIGFGKKLLLSDIVSTEMASMDENINKAESFYFSLIAKVEYYSVENNTLKLMDGNKNTLLIFEKV